jgi:hypothetical protein
VVAEVIAVYLYHASCAECCEWSESSESEESALEWAANHNAEYHNENDRTDADYDHYKESLRDQQ